MPARLRSSELALVFVLAYLPEEGTPILCLAKFRSAVAGAFATRVLPELCSGPLWAVPVTSLMGNSAGAQATITASANSGYLFRQLQGPKPPRKRAPLYSGTRNGPRVSSRKFNGLIRRVSRFGGSNSIYPGLEP